MVTVPGQGAASPRERAVPWPAILAAVPWALSVAGPYHFDDFTTPARDPASASLGAFLRELPRTIRPLTKLTYAIEGSLGLGEVPWARRLVSIAILIGLGASLLRILKALAVPRALGALLVVAFVAHPIQAEGVLAVAGRSAVLSALLGALAVEAALAERIFACAALLGGAALARETGLAFALPVAAALLSTGEGTRWARLRRLEWPATIALATLGFIALHARYQALGAYSLSSLSYRPHVAAQLSAIPVGLSLYLRPGALTMDHGERLAERLGDPLAIGGIALLVAIAALGGWAALRQKPLVAIGCAFVLAALIPTQTIIPKLDALTERPFATALFGVTLALAEVLRALPRPALLRAALSAACLAAAFFTMERGHLYASELRLLADSAGKSVARARPHENYALELRTAGQPALACEEARRARAIEPLDIHAEDLCTQICDPLPCEVLDPRWIPFLNAPSSASAP
ncbi:MAG: hypothetical protein U0359_26260 [Byssovorax sp.]